MFCHPLETKLLGRVAKLDEKLNFDYLGSAEKLQTVEPVRLRVGWVTRSNEQIWGIMGKNVAFTAN